MDANLLSNVIFVSSPIIKNPAIKLLKVTINFYDKTKVVKCILIFILFIYFCCSPLSSLVPRCRSFFVVGHSSSSLLFRHRSTSCMMYPLCDFTPKVCFIFSSVIKPGLSFLKKLTVIDCRAAILFPPFHSFVTERKY